ncbi:hypothetical protein C7C46_22555 [Streptomyces tateyamensis]|uniref:Tetratricopeptide repeat protein n=1 Tax=Streptomyces tateyamensis TaxID=565073 RepID=A0A2V4NKZ3_9ACTN|nr:hypothetical protein C7C46_22555 [Streptomyces tateyamensis]
MQHMVDLRPGTPSLARASYAWELRGDVAAATENMKRALDDANTPADRAFTLYHLAQLALDSGDQKTALAHAEEGLRVIPGSAELLEGRAKAEAALGNTDTALADYTSALAKVPQPANRALDPARRNRHARDPGSRAGWGDRAGVPPAAGRAPAWWLRSAGPPCAST